MTVLFRANLESETKIRKSKSHIKVTDLLLKPKHALLVLSIVIASVWLGKTVLIDMMLASRAYNSDTPYSGQRTLPPRSLVPNFFSIYLYIADNLL